MSPSTREGIALLSVRKDRLAFTLVQQEGIRAFKTPEVPRAPGKRGEEGLVGPTWRPQMPRFAESRTRWLHLRTFNMACTSRVVEVGTSRSGVPGAQGRILYQLLPRQSGVCASSFCPWLIIFCVRKIDS